MENKLARGPGSRRVEVATEAAVIMLVFEVNFQADCNFDETLEHNRILLGTGRGLKQLLHC